MPAKVQLPVVLRWGGFAAGIVMIAFGIGAIVNGIDGRSTTRNLLEDEKIVGTPDMAPAETEAALEEAGLTDKVEVPDCDVAEEPIDTGSEARCFSEYMRVHALEATGGFVFSEMGRFEAKPNTPEDELAPGGGTSNEEFAVIDPKTGEPAENEARNVWIDRTALATALDVSYMAEQISLFGIVVGVALLLSGIGFIILAAAALHRSRSTQPES
jgi:F0F1-type ATP synthase membrane subunit c/vacuolar-type H+-ATPase subunit K